MAVWPEIAKTASKLSPQTSIMYIAACIHTPPHAVFSQMTDKFTYPLSCMSGHMALYLCALVAQLSLYLYKYMVMVSITVAKAKLYINEHVHVHSMQ